MSKTDGIWRRAPWQLAIVALSLVHAAACSPTSSDANDLTRLALLDLATAIQAVNADTACGFESPAAVRTQQVSGNPGSMGSVVRTISGCTVDLDSGPDHYPFFACDAAAGAAHGRVTFSGTRTIRGQVVGVSASPPVIPATSQAVDIEITEADFDNFEVSRTDKSGSVQIVNGAVSGSVKLALAADKADGLCQAPTPNAHLEGIAFSNATMRFKNVLAEATHVVASSQIEAVNGTVGELKNQLQGTMTLDGKAVQIPVGGAPAVFDEFYDPQTFESSFACPMGEAEMPVSYQCATVTEALSTNSARAAFLGLIDLVSLLESDTTCGFNSSAVQGSAVVQGQVGLPGTKTLQVQNCTIAMPGKGLTLKGDCAGHADHLTGEVTVSATKVMRGVLTNDPGTPVVPMTDAAVDYQIKSSSFKEVTIQHQPRVVTFHSGSLSGTVHARVAQGTNYGVCQVPTTIAEFEGVNLSNAGLTLSTDRSTTVTATVVSSELSGINGNWEGKGENVLGGTISTGGQSVRLPVDDDPNSKAFDTAYDPVSFGASWQCAAGLAKPVSFDCSKISLPVPETVSRLAIGMLGAIAGYIEKEATCGFSSPAVISGASYSDSVGNQGTGNFTVQSCVLNFPQLTPVSTDCINRRTVSVQGKVTVNATKTMKGYLTGSSSQPVLPNSLDATAFNLSLSLDGVTYVDDSPGGKIGMTVQSGTLSGGVQPRMALDKTTSACSLSTPITTFSNVTMGTGTMVNLSFPGLSYPAPVTALQLNGQSGQGSGGTNVISGTVGISGNNSTFPIRGSSALDPNYTQAIFDQSYQCGNLQVAKTDADCDFTPQIALQAGRALPLIVQAIATEVSADQNCGLDVQDGQLQPQLSRDGALSVGTWYAPHGGGGTCQFGAAQQQDCDGGVVNLNGRFPVSAQLVVRGDRANMRGTDYINPRSPDAPTDYLLTVSNFTGLSVTSARNNVVTQGIQMPSGTLSAHFNPIMGLETNRQFTYLTATPVNRFVDIDLQGPAPVTLTFNGMQFNANLGEAHVTYAFSGTYVNASNVKESNALQATVTLNGRSFDVNDRLDPNYDPQEFNNRYFGRGCANSPQAPVYDARLGP